MYVPEPIVAKKRHPVSSQEEEVLLFPAKACSEAATYPFEVVRRHPQMQSHARKLSTVATCVKIIEQGSVPALYAGLIPSNNPAYCRFYLRQRLVTLCTSL
ncbi:hypothetical protein Bca52824_009847 [Brassica carinata]|uniref:Uncharacterized protein n=1 Tax=Brassica carinata TaxID=52824 RepID=A0A8X7WAM8_BRACI|nr:hypothetical protein Bca52824_009847 [Brassica carinata]